MIQFQVPDRLMDGQKDRLKDRYRLYFVGPFSYYLWFKKSRSYKK